MKTLLKWAGRGFAALLMVFVLAAAFVWLRSEATLRQTYPKPTSAGLKLDGGAAQIERGRHLATIYGCNDCHGADLTGLLFHDEPAVARLWAPNLTHVARDWSAEDIDRALRHGVRPDGRGLWVMPASAFSRLSDEDASAVIAYLKTQGARGSVRPRLKVGPVGRVGVVLGKFEGEVELLKAPRAPADLGPQLRRGRYLAMTACAECHGMALEGSKGALTTPDLTIAAAYDKPGFERFLRTGVAADGKPRGLMTQMAKTRFAHFTPEEFDALYAYLVARAERQ